MSRRFGFQAACRPKNAGTARADPLCPGDPGSAPFLPGCRSPRVRDRTMAAGSALPSHLDAHGVSLPPRPAGGWGCGRPRRVPSLQWDTDRVPGGMWPQHPNPCPQGRLQLFVWHRSPDRSEAHLSRRPGTPARPHQPILRHRRGAPTVRSASSWPNATAHTSATAASSTAPTITHVGSSDARAATTGRSKARPITPDRRLAARPALPGVATRASSKQQSAPAPQDQDPGTGAVQRAGSCPRRAGTPTRPPPPPPPRSWPRADVSRRAATCATYRLFTTKSTAATGRAGAADRADTGRVVDHEVVVGTSTTDDGPLAASIAAISSTDHTSGVSASTTVASATTPNTGEPAVHPDLQFPSAAPAQSSGATWRPARQPGRQDRAVRADGPAGLEEPGVRRRSSEDRRRDHLHRAIQFTDRQHADQRRSGQQRTSGDRWWFSRTGGSEVAQTAAAAASAVQSVASGPGVSGDSNQAWARALLPRWTPAVATSMYGCRHWPPRKPATDWHPTA